MKKWFLLFFVMLQLAFPIFGGNVTLKKIFTNQYVSAEVVSAPTSLRDLQTATEEDYNSWVNLSRFDGRKYDYVTSVKDQDGPICWSYANLATSEANILRKGIDSSATKENLDFDEKNYAKHYQVRDGNLADPLGLTTEDNFGLTEGPPAHNSGYCEMAFYLMTQGNAPIAESTNNGNDYFQSNYFIRKTIKLPNDPNNPEYMKAVKMAILKYGSVTVDYTIPGRFLYCFDKDGRDENGKPTTHASTIVGWDDSIDRTLFRDNNGDELPVNNGAWIVKNTWGDVKNYENINGVPCMYLSYESHIDFFVAAEFELRSNYQNIYYYGGNPFLSQKNPSVEKDAAIYKAQLTTNNKVEKLDAVVVATNKNNVDLTVKIYKNLKSTTDVYWKKSEGRTTDNNDPTNGTLVATLPTYHADFIGYHTIDIDEDIYLNKGEYFSIVVEHDKGGVVMLARDGNDEYPGSTNDMTYFYNNGVWHNYKYYKDVYNNGKGDGDKYWKTARIRAITNTVDRKQISGASITLSGSMVYTGNQIKPNVKVMYSGVTLKEDTEYTVTFSNNINAGTTAQVKIVGCYKYVGEKTQNFTISKADWPKNTPPDVIYISRTATKLSEISLKDYDGWEWQNSDFAIGNAERYSVVAEYTKSDSSNYLKTSKSITLIKNAPKSIVSIDVRLKTNSYVYDGKIKEPEVIAKDSDYELVLNKDYYVEYEKNANAGTRKVTVTGINNYTGTKILEFTITKAQQPKNMPKKEIIISRRAKELRDVYICEDWDWENPSQPIVEDEMTAEAIYVGDDAGNYEIVRIVITLIKESRIDINKISVLELEKNSFVYDGEVKMPTVVARHDGWGDLVLGVDFEVEYDKNPNVGEREVKVTGINDFIGSKILYFNITKADSPKNKPDSKIIISRKLTTLGEVDLNCKDWYWLNPEQEIKYDEMIATAYYDGFDKDNYTNLETKITIKKEDRLDISGISILKLEQDSFVYDGEVKMPTVVARHDGWGELVPGVDFEVEYDKNPNVGEREVKVTGINDFIGSKILNFNITKADSPKNKPDSKIIISRKLTTLGEVDLNCKDWYWLNPEQEIKYDEMIATAYYDGFDKNNYSNLETKITIKKENRLDISRISVLKLEKDSFVYDGDPKMPKVIAYDDNWGELTAADDFEVQYDEDPNVGIKQVTVVGVNNFTGSKVLEFEISQATRSNFRVYLQSWVYLEQANEPIVYGVESEIGSATINFQYASVEDEYYRNEKPTNAGSYYVKAIIDETRNYKRAESKAEFKISKALWPVNVPASKIVIERNVTRLGNVALNCDGWYWRNDDEQITEESMWATAEYRSLDSLNYENITKDINVVKTGKKSIADISVLRLEYTIITYDGQIKTPEVIAFVDGVGYLALDHDYTVVYEQDPNAGQKNVEVTGINDYDGSVTLTFKIKKAERNNFKVTIDGWVYGDKPSEPVVSGVEEETNITYKYSAYRIVSFGDEKPTDAGRYRIMAIAEESKNYKHAECSNSFEIKQAEGNISKLSIADWIYSETPSTPQIKSTSHDISDATIKYSLITTQIFSEIPPTQVGTYKMVVSFPETKNYTDCEASVTFQILPKDIKNITFEMNAENLVYTGKAIKPQFKLVNKSIKLSENKDYKVSFKNNTTAGTGQIIIEGKTNYTGKIEKSFEISKATRKNFKVYLSNWIYLEQAPEPLISGEIEKANITYYYSKELDGNYELQQPSNAGKYFIKAVIDDSINYSSAEYVAEFEILKAEKPNISTTIYIDYIPETLSDIVLPENLRWQDGTMPITSKIFTAVVIYEGADAENYKQTEFLFNVYIQTFDETTEETDNGNFKMALLIVSPVAVFIIIFILAAVTFKRHNYQ